MSVDLVKNKFDVKAFNTGFTKYMKEQKEVENQQNIAKLKQLNTEEETKKKISEMSFNELINEWTTSLIGILDDLINFRLNPSTLFGENRMFFVGITLLLVVILFYFFYWLFIGFSPNIIKDEHVINISLNIPEQKQSLFKLFMTKLLKKNNKTEDEFTF